MCHWRFKVSKPEDSTSIVLGTRTICRIFKGVEILFLILLNRVNHSSLEEAAFEGPIMALLDMRFAVKPHFSLQKPKGQV